MTGNVSIAFRDFALQSVYERAPAEEQFTLSVFTSGKEPNLQEVVAREAYLDGIILGIQRIAEQQNFAAEFLVTPRDQSKLGSSAGLIASKKAIMAVEQYLRQQSPSLFGNIKIDGHPSPEILAAARPLSQVVAHPPSIQH